MPGICLRRARSGLHASCRGLHRPVRGVRLVLVANDNGVLVNVLDPNRPTMP